MILLELLRVQELLGIATTDTEARAFLARCKERGLSISDCARDRILLAAVRREAEQRTDGALVRAA